jgi:inhibitor of KinA sporulation pathway (predicted exonuclease)
MKVMSLDAEYNQPSKKAIEIGAAIYDAKSGELIDTFETLVNPGEPISQEIVELTGITNSMVVNAPNIGEAFKELKAFHAKHKVFRNPIVWGSGYRNDSLALWEESGPIEENFMGYRVIDAKSIFQSIQIYKNKQFGGGLEKICNEILKIGFEGSQHRALVDAKNAFRVWHFLVSRYPDFR